MSTITQEQVVYLHNQVQNIARYFSEPFFTEQAVSKLYRLIRKINCVRHLTELNPSQYDITKRHLRHLEHAGHLYALARFAMEKAILQQMLKFEFTLTSNEYERHSLSGAELDKIQKIAGSVVSLTQLFGAKNPN